MVRELERDNRIVSFRLTIADRPGLLGQIATTLGRLGANILEVDHRRMFLDVPAKGARLDVTVETRDAAHAEEILRALEADGFAPVRIDPGDAMDDALTARFGAAGPSGRRFAGPCGGRSTARRIAAARGVSAAARPRQRHGPIARARRDAACAAVAGSGRWIGSPGSDFGVAAPAPAREWRAAEGAIV